MTRMCFPHHAFMHGYDPDASQAADHDEPEIPVAPTLIPVLAIIRPQTENVEPAQVAPVWTKTLQTAGL